MTSFSRIKSKVWLNKVLVFDWNRGKSTAY